jgi:metal-responsive CopG/Arc/MetJ family transcriptional regulator
VPLWYSNNRQSEAAADALQTEARMSVIEVAITLYRHLLQRFDRLVAERKFPGRGQAIRFAVQAQIDRLDRRRLARECAKLAPAYEQQLAEETASDDLESWPGY